MISFVIPAYNEARQISQVVRCVRDAAEAMRQDYEILVINDNSSDETAARAHAAGVAVVHVKKRQISAVRNAGAKVARGELLVFVDGDTFLNAECLAAALRALESGAVGGGALFRFDQAPLVSRFIFGCLAHCLRWLGYCGGCFIYVRRDAFEQVDGFDESLFAGEEVQLMKALQQVGRVTVVREPVITSGRKVRRFSLSTLMRLMFRIVFRGRPAVSKREGLEVWYDGVREPFAAHERPSPHNG